MSSQTQAQDGPSSSKRIQNPRSHSSPSLTHWMGTPNGGMKRSWNPSTSSGVAISSIDDKNGIGRIDKGKGKEIGIEEGLSQLYVNHEKQEASSTSTTSIRVDRRRRSPVKRNDLPSIGSSGDVLVPDQPTTTNRNTNKEEEEMKQQARGWTSSLFNNALNVGVFSAALGLTAYRLISNQPQPPPNLVETRSTNNEDEEIGIIVGEGAEEEEVLDRVLEDEESTMIECEDEPIVEDDHGQPASEQHMVNSAEQDSNSLIQEEDQQEQSQADQVNNQPISNNVLVISSENDLPPPPAYEETEISNRKKEGYGVKEWEDIDEYLMTPSSSKLSKSPNHLTHHQYSPSPSPSPSHSFRKRRKVKSQIQKSKSMRNSLLFHHPLSNSRSLPSIEIYHDNGVDSSSDNNNDGMGSVTHATLELGNEGMVVVNNDKDKDRDEARSSDEEPNEVISRLDAMTLKLSNLIEQGKKALENTPGLGTTPGWEDDTVVNDLFSPGYNSDVKKIDQPNPLAMNPASASASPSTSTPPDNALVGPTAPSNPFPDTKRESKIPMKVGSNLYLKQNKNRSKDNLQHGHELNHKKVGSSSEFEGSSVGHKSRIPVRSRSMISGLNAL